MELKDLPGWISAIAAVVSVVGILLAYSQLRLSRKVAQLHFEDGLSREFREIAAKLPKVALMGGSIPDNERDQYFDEFFRYFDLCNEQTFLRMKSRVCTATWNNWRSGIRAMLGRTAFKDAWQVVLGYPRHGFDELARLITEDFQSDPLSW